MRSAASATVAAHSTATPGHGPVPNAAGSDYLTSAALAASEHISEYRAPMKGSPGPVGQAGSKGFRPPPLSESFADRGLTMLGRTWATTTPTGGLPLECYADNIERYMQQYEGAAAAAVITPTRSSGSSAPRPTSAPASRRPHPLQHQTGGAQRMAMAAGGASKGGGSFLTPQKPKRMPDVMRSGSSSGRTVLYQ